MRVEYTADSKPKITFEQVKSGELFSIHKTSCGDDVRTFFIKSAHVGGGSSLPDQRATRLSDGYIFLFSDDEEIETVYPNAKVVTQ